MFRLESYITPFLMSYLDRYVKLRQEDFQLSLWSGAAVLTKLDLRLDAIEKQLQLPVSLKSGHIHELKIQIPWTKLGSEPVVITVSTIECVVTLCNTADVSDGSSSAGSGSRDNAAKMPRNRSRRKLPAGAADEDIPPPGYIQSLLNRIVNNVNIVVDNLIFKFVEEDIVLSLNVKSAELFSVNSEWRRAFVEVSLPDLILRRVLELSDLTVCLDKRDASGKVETYQDPVLYRCSLSIRAYMRHSSLHSSTPSLVRLHALCDRLDLSLTDVQLPMAARLTELALALYYGEYDPLSSGPASESTAAKEPSMQATSAGLLSHGPDMGLTVPAAAVPPESQGSWVSWAWSYVPRILPASGNEASDPKSLDVDLEGPDEDAAPSVFDVAFYVRQATLIFKLSKPGGPSTSFGAPFPRVVFEPFLEIDFSGVAMEILIRGMLFMDVQLGVTYLASRGIGSCVCNYTQSKEDGAAEPDFMIVGSTVEKAFNYLTGSLFDASRHHSAVAAYIFDMTKHYEKYTESWALDRFGALWVNYFWQEDDPATKIDKNNGTDTDGDSELFLHEVSYMKFWFGSATVNITSSARHHWAVFIYHLKNHDYVPYAKPYNEKPIDGTPLSSAQAVQLENFIPTKNVHLALLSCTVNLYASDHSDFDVTTAQQAVRKKGHASNGCDGRGQQGSVFIQARADRFDLCTVTPMYPRRVVKLVSRMPVSPAGLLHQCTHHTQCEAQGLALSLVSQSGNGLNLSISSSIVAPCTVALDQHLLLHTSYWKDINLELSQIALTTMNLAMEVTMPQIYLIRRLIESLSNPQVMEGVFKTTLVGDAFAKPCARELLAIAVDQLNLKQSSCHASTVISGVLGSLSVAITSRDSLGHECETTPVLCAPAATAHSSNGELFSCAAPPPAAADHQFLSFTCQTPNKAEPLQQAPRVIHCNASGFSVNADAVILDFCSYEPRDSNQSRAADDVARQDVSLVLDANLVNSSSPLNALGSSICSSDGRPARDKPSTAGSHGQPRNSETGARAHAAGGSSSMAEDMAHGGSQACQLPATHQLQSGTWASSSWRTMVHRLFPKLCSLDLHVSIGSCTAFCLSHHVTFGRRSHFTGLLPGWHDIHRSGHAHLPVLVVCLPAVTVQNTGRKAAPGSSGMQTSGMPITIELTSFSIYTLQSGSLQYMVQPFSATMTIAVTAKEHQQPLDTPSSVAICVHCDTTNIGLGLSEAELHTVIKFMSTWRLLAPMLAAVVHESPKKYHHPMQARASSHVPRQSLANDDATTSGIDVADRRSDGGRAAPHCAISIASASTPALVTADQFQPAATFWLQLTIPKLAVEATVNDHVAGDDVRVVSVFEEWTSSLDVQDVYCKLSTKIWAVDVSHFIKKSKDRGHGQWQTGEYAGMLLACGSRRLRSADVLTSESTGDDAQPCATSHGSSSGIRSVPGHGWQLIQKEHQQPQQQPVQHGFLQAILTRALADNVAQRVHRAEAVSIDDGTESSATSWPCNNKVILSPAVPAQTGSSGSYITEVCLDLQPFDAVLHVPTVARLLQSFTHYKGGVHPQEQPSEVAERLIATGSDGSEAASRLRTQSRKLWLVHLSACEPRLILPAGQDTNDDNGRGPSDEPSGKGDHVIVVMARSVGMSSQTENPLSRLVLDAEMYRKKQKLMDQLGSEVEDRQYQIDVRGWCAAVGNFSELFVKSVPFDDDFASENPAVVWNRQEKPWYYVPPQPLYPILAPFDIRVVLAPAIVYKEELLCGHSIEVNVIKPVTVNLLTCHVPIIKQAASSLFALSEKPSDHVNHQRPHSSAAAVRPQNEKDVLDILADMVPFEVLFTTSKVIVMCSTGERFLSQRLCDLSSIPIMYASLVQPHIFVSTKPGQQHMQLSIYDIAVNSTCNFETSVPGMRLPDLGDFGLKVLETKPGTPSVKTGILPAFFTANVQKLLIRGGAKVALAVERPVRLNVSASWLESFLGKLVSSARHQQRSDSCLSASGEGTTATGRFSEQAHPRWLLQSPLNHAAIRMEQVVLEYVTKDVDGTHRCNSGQGISASVDKLSGDLSFSQYSSLTSDRVVQANCYMQLKNMQLRTNLRSGDDKLSVGRNISSDLVAGPFTASVNARASSHPHSGAPGMPHLLLVCDLSPLPVRTSQQTLQCLMDVVESVNKIFKQYSCARGDGNAVLQSEHNTTLEKLTDRQQRSPLQDIAMTNVSRDDLRMGALQYVLHESGHDRTKPNTAALLNEKDYGALSWCYPEARLLQAIHINPIPFDYRADSAEAQFGMAAGSRPQEASCSVELQGQLQYWDELAGMYVDYAVFAISEQHGTDVTLHSPTDPHAVAAASWRILIFYAILGEEDDDDCSEDDRPSAARQSSKWERRTRAVALPSVLLAATKVDSCFVPYLVPSIQFALSCEAVKLTLCCQRISNADLKLMASHALLKPFSLAASSLELMFEHELLLMELDDVRTTTSTWGAGADSFGAASKLEMSGNLAVSTLDKRYLGWCPLLHSVDLEIFSESIHETESEEHTIRGKLTVGPAYLTVSQGTIDALLVLVESWTASFKGHQAEAAIFMNPMIASSYSLCNNTQYHIVFGQADTDEALTLGPGQYCPYTWRTGMSGGAEKWHVCLEAEGGRTYWSESMSVDTFGTKFLLIKVSDEVEKVLVIDVRQLSATHTQIVISGTAVVASLLQGISLELRLSDHTGTSRTLTLDCERRFVSHVMSTKDTLGVQVRHGAADGDWSDEIRLPCGDGASGNSFLVKVAGISNEPIRVWCTISVSNGGDAFNLSSSKSFKCYLLQLTPLFVIRSFLPTSLYLNIESSREQVLLPGGGNYLELTCADSSVLPSDIPHLEVSLQMSNDEPSSAPFMISAQRLLQAGGLPRSHSEPIKSIFDSCLRCCTAADAPSDWPKILDELMEKRLSGKLQPLAISKPCLQRPSCSERPECTTSNNGTIGHLNIDLGWRWRWDGLYTTLLVDVRPKLLFANTCSFSVMAVSCDDSILYYLPARGCIVPAGHLKDGFKVGIIPETGLQGLYMSATVKLSDEEYTPRSSANYTDRHVELHTDSYCCVSVMAAGSGSHEVQVIYLTLRSHHYEGVHVVVVAERFVVANKSGRDAVVRCVIVNSPGHDNATRSTDDGGPRLHDWAEQTVLMDSVVQGISPIPVLRTHSEEAGSHKSDIADKAAMPQPAELVVSFAFGSGEWCHPVVIAVNEGLQQQCLAITSTGSDQGYAADSYVLTCHSCNGTQYLVVQRSPQPPLVLHNESSCALYYGEAAAVGDASGVLERPVPLLGYWLPVLPPHSSVTYAFPSLLAAFPIVAKGRKFPRLRIAPVNASEEITRDSWSSPIDLDTPHVTFAAVPSLSTDAKVTKQRVGHTLHVYIDFVSRVEILSREYLGSYGNNSKKEAIFLAGSSPSLVGGHRRTDAAKASSAAEVVAEAVWHRGAQHQPEKTAKLELEAVFEMMSLVLLDECVLPGHITEFLCATVEQLHLRMRSPPVQLPPSSSPASCSSDCSRTRKIMVAVGDVQVDNQMYSRGSFDFDVVLWTRKSISRSGVLRAGCFDECIAKDAFAIVVNLDLLCQDGRSLQGAAVNEVVLQIQPVHLQLEDRFLQHLLRKMESFNTVFAAFTQPSFVAQCSYTPREAVAAEALSLRLPARVRRESDELTAPLRLRRLLIQPCELLVSVHASVKMFIATDNAVLKFGELCREDIVSSPAHLLRAVLTHYAASTLFRAGWVVGSLDIIGNPAGLVRSFATGMSDLVYLPYAGLANGPGSFVGGVSSGISSALRHITAGTLTSVMNFAQSLSRNMDRLSLDEEYAERQDSYRRIRPERLSQGLLQGLTGLGLSLLGAVAGLADQPLQTLFATSHQASSMEHGGMPEAAAVPRTRVNRAVGLVTGISKGLIGMVTKPIGGTAELISQTSQGLLHSIGLKSCPATRHTAIVAQRFLNANYSWSKYARKFQQIAAHGELLAMLTVQHMSASHKESGYDEGNTTLLLLPEVIFVINALDDNLQQAFAISEIECNIRPSDPRVTASLYLEVVLTNTRKSFLDEDEDMAKNRVEEYVDSTSAYTTRGSDLEGASGIQTSLNHRTRSASGKTVLHEYLITDPSQAAIFLAQFNLTKARRMGRGFL